MSTLTEPPDDSPGWYWNGWSWHRLLISGPPTHTNAGWTVTGQWAYNENADWNTLNTNQLSFPFSTDAPETKGDRPRQSDTKRIHLERTEDVSGVSGTGTVAQGVEFKDGSAVVRWMSENSSTVIWKNVDEMMEVHGHQGKTRLVWDD